LSNFINDINKPLAIAKLTTKKLIILKEIDFTKNKKEKSYR